MSGTFHVYQDRAGKFRWRLKASNGRVVATGEAHPDAQGARRQCEEVSRAVAGAKVEVVEA